MIHVLVEVTHFMFDKYEVGGVGLDFENLHFLI